LDRETLSPAKPRPGSRLALWGAVALLLATAGFGFLVAYFNGQPDDGTDSLGMLLMSCFLMAIFCFVGAVALTVFGIILRKRPNVVRPTAAWYPDPTGQAALRYWDGTVWTDHTA